MLIEVQKTNPSISATTFLESYSIEKDKFLSQIVVDDKTWAHVTLGSKQQIYGMETVTISKKSKVQTKIFSQNNQK